MPDEPQTIVAEAGDIMQRQLDEARAQTGDIIEHATEEINIANERAAEIAQAAMQTEIGRRVGAIEQGATEWHALCAELRQELSSLRAEVSDLKAAVAATATLTVAQALAPSADPLSLSIPPISSNPETMPEAVEAITEVLPGNLENVEVPSPVPVEPVKRNHRFL